MMFDNYSCDNQMSIFDFIEQEQPKSNQNIVDDVVKKQILRGSGFQNGKTRIFNYFKENHSEKDKAEFLKKEYGVGGWSMENGWCNHDAKGFDIEFKEPIGKTTAIHIGYPMLVKRIDALIKSGEYKPDKPKLIGFCHATNHDCNNVERQKIAFDLGFNNCYGGCCVPCEFKHECGARCCNWNYGGKTNEE